MILPSSFLKCFPAQLPVKSQGDPVVLALSRVLPLGAHSSVCPPYSINYNHAGSSQGESDTHSLTLHLLTQTPKQCHYHRCEAEFLVSLSSPPPWSTAARFWALGGNTSLLPTFIVPPSPPTRYWGESLSTQTSSQRKSAHKKMLSRPLLANCMHLGVEATWKQSPL